MNDLPIWGAAVLFGVVYIGIRVARFRARVRAASQDIDEVLASLPPRRDGSAE